MNTGHELLPGAVVLSIEVLEDYRGSFVETYQANRLRMEGIDVVFQQDNRSYSHKHVLRGLHYQINKPQGHLVTVLRGSIFDVGLDLRKGSPTFGTCMTKVLSGDRPCQLWLPAGIAHGFCVTSDGADILYKCTDMYTPGDEGGVAWNDPKLGIKWPVQNPVISEKDNRLPSLEEIPAIQLPQIEFS